MEEEGDLRKYYEAIILSLRSKRKRLILQNYLSLARRSSGIALREQLGLIIAAGVALRLLVMWAIWSNGGSPLLGDEGNYIMSAMPLSEGRGIPDLWLWIRAPGYIFFAAFVLFLTGGSLLILNVAQVLVFALIAGCIYFLGTLTASEPTTSQRAGLWSAALIALNPLLILSDNFFLSEQLYLLLSALLILFLALYGRAVRQGKERAWLWLAAAGVCGGAGALTRPQLLVFFPLAAVWLLFLHKGRFLQAVGRIALFAVVVLAVILPWSFRNLAHYGRFVLIDTTGTFNFLSSNTDMSPGQTQAAVSKVPNLADRQGYELQMAFDWIGTHKAEFLGRTLARVATSWSPDPFGDLRYPVRDKIPGTPTWGRDLYALAGSLAYLALTVLIIGGLISAQGSDLKTLMLLMLASYVLTIGLSHNVFRYRLPVLGLLSVYGGYCLVTRGVFWPLRRDGAWRVAAIAALLSSLLFALFDLPLIAPGLVQSAQAQALNAQALLQANPSVRRADLFEQAAQVDIVSAWPLREAAQVHAALGNPNKAIDDYEIALGREPDDWRTRALLSALYRATSNTGRSVKLANGVLPTFNGIMQDWAWERSPQPPATVDVAGPDIGWVRGFQIGEGIGTATSYRWSTGNAAIKVGRDASARRVVIHARALPDPNGQPITVRWSVDGVAVGEVSMDANWRDYSFDLPPSTSTVAVIGLNAPARRPSVEDSRQLAVAVDWVKSEP